MSQEVENSYGTGVAVNTADGRASLYTIGNRNPEGLFIDDNGEIWETEHGPQGGD